MAGEVGGDASIRADSVSPLSATPASTLVLIAVVND
jgi:hypothetical protein